MSPSPAEPTSISVLDSDPNYSLCQCCGTHSAHSHHGLECCTYTLEDPLVGPPDLCDTGFYRRKCTRLAGAKGLHFFQSWKNGLSCCETLDNSFLPGISAGKEPNGMISVNPAHMMVLART